MTTRDNPKHHMQLEGFHGHGQPPAEIIFGDHGPTPASSRAMHAVNPVPVHQSALDDDDIKEAVIAAGCNPHAVGQALAAAATVKHEGTVVKLQRSGPNCS